MFDIGFFELTLIGVVLLVVMGPEKLPEVARQGAFFIRKVRAWLTDMKSEMDTQTDGGLSSLKEATHEIAELKASIAQMGRDVMSEVDDASHPMQDSVTDVENDFSELDPEEHFNNVVNDVEPSLVDDEVAGKPKQVAKKVAKKIPAKKEAVKGAPTVTKATAKTSSKAATKKVVVKETLTVKKESSAKKAAIAKKTVSKKKAVAPRKPKTTEKS